MASLVADYSSSSEDEEEHDLAERNQDHGKNFLVSNEEEEERGASSNEDLSQEQSFEDMQNQLPNPFSSNLPPPNLESKPAGTSHLVFSNPFKEEQTRREFILQQHVKMTENSKISNSRKQFCWKFKQGKCRFSKNCKFSHDIDNHIDSPLVKNQNAEIPKQYLDEAFNTNTTEVFDSQPDEDDYMKGKRKKRSGVTDNLVPPKKAMATLNKIQAQERPWTIKR